MKNDSKAFPLAYEDEVQTGMSLRDYFAGQVISGLTMRENQKHGSDLAKMAYTVADAMIEISKKDKK